MIEFILSEGPAFISLVKFGLQLFFVHQVYPHTAIFIFSRDAAAEASSKYLAHGGKRENLALIRRMNSETERTARATGLPVFRMDGELRMGESFGEKFYSAFISVFEAGFRNVIGIGNDCPALSASRLLAAARHLEMHPFVLGPARDGGVYLIGAQKDAISRVPFTGLPWKTSRLFEVMLEEWTGFRVHFLPQERDLDSPGDLYRLLSGKMTNAFKKALAGALSSQGHPDADMVCGIKESVFFHKNAQRGPPLAA